MLPFRHQPIDLIKEAVREGSTQPNPAVPPAQVLVFPPYRFIFVEAADDFLSVNELRHNLPIPEMTSSFHPLEFGSLTKSVIESYALGWPAKSMTDAMTPSATEAMKSRFNVSRVSVERW